MDNFEKKSEMNFNNIPEWSNPSYRSKSSQKELEKLEIAKKEALARLRET